MENDSHCVTDSSAFNNEFQVCDDQWHHYAINVRFPDVELYLDGQLFRSEKKNPEVIDDWPLHPTKGINTTLTVGACWQVSIRITSVKDIAL